MDKICAGWSLFWEGIAEFPRFIWSCIIDVIYEWAARQR
jgi:hypothetical protein